MGSDVNFVVLDVLPRLAPGVVVHFHDIFLPYEYPRTWLEDYALYWNEQYLLQAFLSLNPDYEVLCAVAALSADHSEDFQAILPPAWPRWPAGRSGSAGARADGNGRSDRRALL